MVFLSNVEIRKLLYILIFFEKIIYNNKYIVL